MNKEMYQNTVEHLKFKIQQIKNKDDTISKKEIFGYYEIIERLNLKNTNQASTRTTLNYLDGDSTLRDFIDGKLDYNEILQNLITQKGSYDILTMQVVDLIKKLEEFKWSDQHILGTIKAHEEVFERLSSCKKELNKSLNQLKLQLPFLIGVGLTANHFVSKTLAIKSVNNLTEGALYSLASVFSTYISVLLLGSGIKTIKLVKKSYELHKENKHQKEQNIDFKKEIARLKSDYKLNK